MPKFYTSINLNNNQLQNVSLNPQASAPGTYAAGLIYFDTNAANTSTYNRLVIRNAVNGAWLNIPYSGSIVNADISSNAAVAVQKLDTSSASTGVKLDTIGSPTGSVSFNNQRIANVLTDSNSASTDAATKGYVDAAVSSLNVHAPAQVATTGSETYTASSTAITQISGTTINTYSVQASDRILIKSAPTGGGGAGTPSTDTTSKFNGAYVVTSVSTNINVQRAPDYNGDIAGEVATGDYILVLNGGQKGNAYIMSTTGTITVGTTAIAFTQFGQVTNYTAGNGLSLSTGNQFSVNTNIVPTISGNTTVTFTASAPTSVTLPTSGILVNSSVTTLSSLASVGTITTGVWNGTNISVANGGTGASTASNARTNLAAQTSGSGNTLATKFAGPITNNASSPITVNHKLGTTDVTVQVYETSGGTATNLVFVDVAVTDANNITVSFASQDSAVYRVIVTG